MTQLFDSSDTICAISTAPGVGGIAVARVSGRQAIEIVDKIWAGKKLKNVASHSAHLGNIVNSGDGTVLDQCVATVFKGPNSFTGEDVVELSIHGSKWIQRELISLLVENGCRLAQAGEFTRRAFISGRIDLAQAEGVADLIASSSRASHRLAISQMRGGVSKKLETLRGELLDLASLLELELDFSEEEVEFASRQKLIQMAKAIKTELDKLAGTFKRGAAIKEGIPVAIVGPTNAGKSSLLNAILGDERAIVSDIHGTTRDTIEETIEIGDYLFRFIDTAGLRNTSDEIEQIGIERSRKAIAKARVVILVLDSTSLTPDEYLAELDGSDAKVIVALNKIDLTGSPKVELPYPTFPISAKKDEGIENLINYLGTIMADSDDEDVLLTNARHAQAITAAGHAIAATLTALEQNIPADLVAQDLRETLHHLATITGAISTPEILSTIFTRFCIGK